MRNGRAVRSGHSSRSHEEVREGEFGQALQLIYFYLNSQKFEVSFQAATSTCRMRAGVAQGGILSPVLFSLYVKDMPSSSHHVDLALYADDTAVVATYRQPALFVNIWTHISET
jgi:hypothetical protein